MLKALGRSIFSLFVRPAPTSVALMVGEAAAAANDDQSQLLRRAMRAASMPEEAREPLVVSETRTVEAAVAVPVEAEEPEMAPAVAANDVAEMSDPGEAAETTDDVVAPVVEAAADDVEADSRADEVETGDALEAALPEDVSESDALAAPEAEQFETEVAARAEDSEADSEAGSDEVVDEEVDAELHVETETDVAIEELSGESTVDAAPEVEREREEPIQASDEIVSSEEAVVEEVPARASTSEGVAVEEPGAEAAAEGAADERPELAEEPIVTAAEEGAADEEPTPAAEKKPRKKKSPPKRKAATKTPRKAKAESGAEPVLEDDVWVSDAVAWSLSGEWSGHLTVENPDCPRRLEELREAAAEGRLTIWGRTGDAGTWQPIEPGYWKSGTVEPGSLGQGGENVVAEPKGRAKAKKKYCALKVSRAQVEELWRADAVH